MLEIQIEYSSSKGISEWREIDAYNCYLHIFVSFKTQISSSAMSIFFCQKVGWPICLNLLFFFFFFLWGEQQHINLCLIVLQHPEYIIFICSPDQAELSTATWHLTTKTSWSVHTVEDIPRISIFNLKKIEKCNVCEVNVKQIEITLFTNKFTYNKKCLQLCMGGISFLCWFPFSAFANLFWFLWSITFS